MNKEDLMAYKRKLSELSEEDSMQRDLYLKGLADGTLQGPLTGYPSVDKAWLKYQTPENILKEFEQMSAYQLMKKNSIGHENEIAIEFYGKRITYKQLLSNIDIVAKGLIELGVKKGDVVMMSMPNTPEAEYLFYAINKVGAVLNTIDPRTSPEIIINDAKESETKFFFGIDLLSPIMEKMPNDIVNVAISPYYSMPKLLKAMLSIKNKKYINKSILSWKDFYKKGTNSKVDKIESVYEENSLAAIVHTGGTTGIPKGVLLSNENLNGLIYQMKNGYNNFYRGQSFLNILPPFIALGLNNAMHLSACLGLKSIMIASFEPEDIPKLLFKHKPNVFLCGPIHLKILLKDDFIKDKDLSFLQVICSGGDKMPKEQQEAAQEFLNNHGSKANLWLGYGATEMSAGISCMKDEGFIYESVGIPYLKNNIKICEIDTTDEIQGYGKNGEVYITGPTLMQGYSSKLNNETNDVIKEDENGIKWYKTGDIGHLDDNGMLFIDGRIKRIITRRGFKIYPQYIENIIRQNKYVDDCVIVGIPDEEEISVPVANIVLKEEYAEIEDVKNEVINYVENFISENLPSYTVMAGYNFIENIPLTKIGKIDFKTLEKLGIINEEKKNQNGFKMI